MSRLVVFALLAALLTAPASADKACSLTRPELCWNTNQLVGSTGFFNALRRFLKREKGYFVTGKLQNASDAAILVLGGPPDEPVKLKDGAMLFTACRQHSCDEKGGVIIANGTIRALAVIHFACKRNSCLDQPEMTIFMGSTGGAIDTDAFTAWSQASDTYKHPTTTKIVRLGNNKIWP